MVRRVNSGLWNEWRRRLERQRKSGLSISEFCRRESLSLPSFYSWRRKVATRAGELATGRPCRVRRAAAAPRAAGFLQLPLATVRSSPWVELSLADGTVLRVPQQNTATVLAILRELRDDCRNAICEERDDA
jgi:hypothetical protein